MIYTALRTGNPLPQITPCPLLDRFMLRYHGLNIVHREAEEDYGLPRSLTLETLRNEQYLSVQAPRLIHTLVETIFQNVLRWCLYGIWYCQPP